MKKLIALLFGIVVAFILLELCCQLYAIVPYRQWSRLQTRPDHFYTLSDSPVLGYELAKNRTLDKDGRTLRINALGIREEDDVVPEDVRKIAILGDSVVFGIGLSQHETISALLQQRLDPTGERVKVLNFGVPGYALAELNEFLRIENEIYDVDQVVYILNPNDFCRRYTVTEGSDSGLFRMYRRPWLKAPWMLRKAVYRLKKGGDSVSVGFYRWVFAREGEAGFEEIVRMAEYSQQRDLDFGVVLLPAGCAYRDSVYELRDMHDEIAVFLEQSDIPFLDPVSRLADDPSRYFNPTDHFQLEGNALMADVLHEWLQDRGGPDSTGVRDRP